MEARNADLKNKLKRDLKYTTRFDRVVPEDTPAVEEDMEVEKEEQAVKKKKKFVEPLDDWGEMWDSLRSKKMRKGRRSGLPHAAIMKMADQRKRIM